MLFERHYCMSGWVRLTVHSEQGHTKSPCCLHCGLSIVWFKGKNTEETPFTRHLEKNVTKIKIILFSVVIYSFSNRIYNHSVEQL